MHYSIINKFVYEEHPEVTIETKASESGSSGGLMTALSVYNALVSDERSLSIVSSTLSFSRVMEEEDTKSQLGTIKDKRTKGIFPFIIETYAIDREPLDSCFSSITIRSCTSMVPPGR